MRKQAPALGALENEGPIPIGCRPMQVRISNGSGKVTLEPKRGIEGRKEAFASMHSQS